MELAWRSEERWRNEHHDGGTEGVSLEWRSGPWPGIIPTDSPSAGRWVLSGTNLRYTHRPDNALDLTLWDGIAFVGFLGAVIGISLYASRKEETSEDYFLAGRSLTWWLICFSLIASNISTYHFICMAVSGFFVAGLFRLRCVTHVKSSVAGKVPSVTDHAVLRSDGEITAERRRHFRSNYDPRMMKAITRPNRPVASAKANPIQTMAWN